MGPAALLSVLALLPAQATPRVGAVEELRIERRQAILDGRDLFAGGGYEKLVGRVRFAFDPADPANADVVDLDLADRRADGRVTAVADLMVLRPLRPPPGGGTALVEVSNRGGKAALRSFCRGRGGADPTAAEDFGDAWLLRRGLTIVWLGWQADVPDRAGLLRLRVPVARAENSSPLRGRVRADWVVDEPVDSLPLGHRGHRAYPALPEAEARLTVRSGRLDPRREIERSRWRFGRLVADRFVPDRTWISLAGGFRAGGIYELVYTARDPLVIGLGLAALRDFAAWLKTGSAGELQVERTVAVGISQTGRFLRHFLWQGFNRAPDGGRAFDAMMVLTAGAGRGSFNHRFAQPSRDAHRYSAFFYPTDLFPFASRIQRDPETGREDGLLRRAEADRVLPRLFQVETGYEYWGRAASLVHTTVDGSDDLAPHPAERIYHLRGAQHFPVGWPQPAPSYPAGMRGSPIDNLAVYRALLAALLDWVERGVEPPPSRIPSLLDGTLVPLSEYEWPELPFQSAPKAAHEAYRADYGPRWEQGILDFQPPRLGPAYPVFVPQVDERGNEIAGVPTLETEVPLGTFTPWRLRTPDAAGRRELEDFFGSFLPFARREDQAREADDPRPALEQLYRDEAAYLEAVDAALARLTAERWLLPEDVPRQRREALRRYRSLLAAR
ncbi:MAG: hypothetical protein D6702_01320 [Planctomycetota bacterium]|nr:MAG: hypothetical protein D6702_01320 [Planctomycetota bacterium]